MAKKRMFNSDMGDADAFLDMPNGAKLLYFYLGTKGDDDGFIAKSPDVHAGHRLCAGGSGGAH